MKCNGDILQLKKSMTASTLSWARNRKKNGNGNSRKHVFTVKSF